MVNNEQLAEIEQRWAKWINPKSAPKTLGGDFLILLAEVRRLNRMVDKAIDKLADFGCVVDTDPCPANYIEVGCRGCVIKYLESEVGNNG